MTHEEREPVDAADGAAARAVGAPVGPDVHPAVPPIDAEDALPEAIASRPPRSLLQLRLQKFRRFRRGYYSFLILTAAYLLSFLLPFLMNNKAIVVRYQGRYYFPVLSSYLYDTLGLTTNRIYLAAEFGQGPADNPSGGETDYRRLRDAYRQSGGDDFAILPPIPYGPNEQSLDMEGNPPHPPSRKHWMGTDDRARDVFVRLAYGFRISISFALLVTTVSYLLGIAIGAILGYFGGWTDMLGLRVVEIWSAIPFLYTVIILASLFKPGFLMLASILAAFGWIGITYYIRGEFYREKSKDYVAAAIATGETHRSIIFRHILPNALTPVVSFAPFAIVAEIVALVSLDFLGFGLPAPTPSWGELIGQGKANIRDWHLVVFPLLAMFFTLQLIVFIGEAVREAFDPKVFSRLR